MTTPAAKLSGPGHRMKTWWMILRTSLEERLAYRGDFALGTLMRFLPIITQIFLWSAVYASVGDSLQSDVQESSLTGNAQVVAENGERRNGPAEAGTPALGASDDRELGDRPAEAGTPALGTSNDGELGDRPAEAGTPALGASDDRELGDRPAEAGTPALGASDDRELGDRPAEAGTPALGTSNDGELGDRPAEAGTPALGTSNDGELGDRPAEAGTPALGTSDDGELGDRPAEAGTPALGTSDDGELGDRPAEAGTPALGTSNDGELGDGPAEAGTPALGASDDRELGDRPAEAGTPAQTADDDVELGGYTLAGMVAYYLITMIGRAFSSMPGLASGIARQIREGEIKRYLIQPVDFVGFLMLQRVAHKIAYYTVAILPFALVFFLCRGYFTSGWPPAPQFLAFLATLVMGFLIGFFLEATIGMIGFWFLEVSSLLFIYMLFSFFLSGHMFPLTLLPDSIEWFVQLLPLKYLAYFPAAVFLGKIPPEDLPLELAIEAAWLLFFIFTCRFCYAAGVRRYSGYGG